MTFLQFLEIITFGVDFGSTLNSKPKKTDNTTMLKSIIAK